MVLHVLFMWSISTFSVTQILNNWTKKENKACGKKIIISKTSTRTYFKMLPLASWCLESETFDCLKVISGVFQGKIKCVSLVQGFLKTVSSFFICVIKWSFKTIKVNFQHLYNDKKMGLSWASTRFTFYGISRFD